MSVLLFVIPRFHLDRIVGLESPRQPLAAWQPDHDFGNVRHRLVGLRRQILEKLFFSPFLHLSRRGGLVRVTSYSPEFRLPLPCRVLPFPFARPLAFRARSGPALLLLSAPGPESASSEPDILFFTFSWSASNEAWYAASCSSRILRSNSRAWISARDATSCGSMRSRCAASHSVRRCGETGPSARSAMICREPDGAISARNGNRVAERTWLTVYGSGSAFILRENS